MSASEIEPGVPGTPREVVPRSAERIPASAPSTSIPRKSKVRPTSNAPAIEVPAPASNEAARIAPEISSKLAAKEAAVGASEPAESAPSDPSDGPDVGTLRDRTQSGHGHGRKERRADDTARLRGREVRTAGSGKKSKPENALRWHRTESIPETIRATLKEGIAYANWLVDRSREHPELSVHEYRKTVRRMRAIVRLIRNLIGPRAYLSLETGLRSAVAPTSGLRDARVLLGALDLAAPAGGSAELRESLAAEWEARLAQLESGDEESRVLAASRAPLARISGELRGALPAAISPTELRRAIEMSFRKARRAFRRADQSGEEEQIHAARKRVKELRYQLEWLSTVSGKRAQRRWKRLSSFAQELGEVTDLFILESAVLEHAPAAAPFAERIRAQAYGRWQELVEEQGRLFRERPRKFARGIAKRV